MIENIGLYIDADNISANDFNKIYSELKLKGRIIIKKVYGDWSLESMESWKKVSLNNGLETKNTFNTKEKNSTDMHLTCDILQDLYKKTHIDCFVLLSGDSDYTPVTKVIRSEGKKIICCGYHKSTGKSLINSCDKFISIETLKKHNKKLDNLKSKILSILENKDYLNLGRLKELLLLDNPSFDVRNHGFKKMNELINNFNDILQVTRSDDRLTLFVSRRN